jgi:hypothetical protein
MAKLPTPGLLFPAFFGVIILLGGMLFLGMSSAIASDDAEGDFSDLPEALTPFYQALKDKNHLLALDILQNHSPADSDPMPSMNVRMAKGFRPLHRAAYFGNADLCLQIIRYGGKVTLPDPYGNTPLHIAAQYGHSACIATLALKGANLNTRNGEGKTPLHLAVDNDMPDAVKALIRLGANPKIRDQEGKTCAELADTEETKESLKLPPLSGKRPLLSQIIILWGKVRDDGRWYSSDRETIEELLARKDIPALEIRKTLRKMMADRGIPNPK